jgi:hypothetical protein
MKHLFLFIAFIAIMVSSKAQFRFQTESKFVPYIVGAAAMGGVEVLKDIKSWHAENIWSAVGVGLRNKNTSIDIAGTSYEWGHFKDIYVGIGVGRRLFYIGKFEPWVSLSYSVPLEGRPEFKFQPAIRGKFWLDKNIALGLGYEQVLDKKQNFNLISNRAVEFSVVVRLPGHVHDIN